MNSSSSFGFCVLLVFLCTFQSGLSLECYTCNFNSSVLDEDGCKNIHTVLKCQDPALCLSATYSIKDGSAKEQFTTIKSCQMKMAGQECDNFIKNMKQLYPMSAKLEFVGKKCYTCEKDRCDGPSSASIVLPTILVFIASFVSTSCM